MKEMYPHRPGYRDPHHAFFPYEPTRFSSPAKQGVGIRRSIGSNANYLTALVEGSRETLIAPRAFLGQGSIHSCTKERPALPVFQAGDQSGRCLTLPLPVLCYCSKSQSRQVRRDAMHRTLHSICSGKNGRLEAGPVRPRRDGILWLMGLSFNCPLKP